jgi:TonB family protein
MKTRIVIIAILCLAPFVAFARGPLSEPTPFPREEPADPNVQLPVLIERAPVVYPKDAADHNLVDEIHVAFIVESSGRVTNVRAFFSRHPALEPAAVSSVQNWKFKPATMRGHPIGTRMVVAVKVEPPK